MTFIVARLGVGDFDEWKKMFDSDPAGRAQTGKGHRLLRNVEDPNEVLVAVEFPSVDDAREFQERLRTSGALDRIEVKAGPTIAEEVETVTY